MDIEIVNYPKNYKKLLYLAGRNCYGLETLPKNITKNELDTFISKIIKNNHTNVLEHCNVSIYIKDCPRSLMGQLVRHRHCTFSVKSQHFVEHKDFKYADFTDSLGPEYNAQMENIKLLYNNYIDNGIPHYIAREILPNSCLTNIFMTSNITEYRYIISLRITNNNIPIMISFTKHLLRTLYLKMPELFDDLVDKYDPDKNIY